MYCKRRVRKMLLGVMPCWVVTDGTSNIPFVRFEEAIRAAHYQSLENFWQVTAERLKGIGA